MRKRMSYDKVLRIKVEFKCQARYIMIKVEFCIQNVNFLFIKIRQMTAAETGKL